MGAATQDHRLAEIEDKIGAARGMLADIAKSTAPGDARERQRAAVQHELDRLQDMQLSALKMFSNGNGYHRSTGWRVEKLEAVEERLKAVSHTAARFGAVSLGEVASKQELVDELGLHVKADVVAPASSRQEFFGAVPQPRRPLTLLDLIPSAAITNNSLDYIVESGAWTAAETAEGATKPESAVTLTEATAQAETVAGWLKTQKQSVADWPALQDLIATRLRYAVMRRLETQVISGNGTTPNLRGVLNTSGILTVAFVASSSVSDMIARGIGAVVQAEGQPDGIAMNPTDWLTATTAKTTGSGEYISGGPFAATDQRLWSIPVVLSPVVPVGTALIADWRRAATVLVRQGVTVLVSDSDQDDFVRNRLTILGEGRFAFACWLPGLIAKVALA